MNTVREQLEEFMATNTSSIEYLTELDAKLKQDYEEALGCNDGLLAANLQEEWGKVRTELSELRGGFQYEVAELFKADVAFNQATR